MSSNAYRGALLGILAALLLVNPTYVGVVVDDPESRTPTGYTATEITLTNATDQRALITELGDDEVLDAEQFADANEYSPYGDRYRAPAEAAERLRTAAADGTATTDAADVRFTLQRIGANYRYLRLGDGDATRYYRFDVTGESEQVVVAAEAVNRSTVARHVFYRDARQYSSLPGYQRETVDAVVTADDYYRPTNDEFHEVTRSVVVRDGQPYVFEAAIHVDDFGPSAKSLVSLALSGLGVLALFVSVAFTLEATWRRRQRD